MAEQENNNTGHVHTSITTAEEVKKTPLQKAAGIFFAEDLDNIKDSVMDTYVKPRAKSFVQELVRKSKEFMLDNITSVAEMFIFGKGGKTGQGTKTGEYNGQKINYVSYYTPGTYIYDGNTYYGYGASGQPVAPSTPGVMLKTYGIAEYEKAQRVLGELLALSKRYPVVTVGDYYQLIGAPTTKQDFNYGWKAFDETVEIIYQNGKYIIMLPKPMPLQ